MYWITTFKYILNLHVEASVYFMYKHYTLSKYSTMKRGVGWGGVGGVIYPHAPLSCESHGTNHTGPCIKYKSLH